MAILCRAELVYGPVAIGDDVAQLLSSSLELFELEIDPIVPIGQQGLQLCPFLFESFDEGLVVGLERFDVEGVQTGQALLHIE